MSDFRRDRFHNIERVWIPFDKLHSGIDFVSKHKIEAVYILFPGNHNHQVIDFSFLNEIPFIKSLELSVRLHKDSNIDGIYSINELVNLSYFENDKFPLDHSRLPCLRSLYTHFSQNHLNSISNFEKMDSLESLKIWHLDTEDCSLLMNLSNLESLEIAHGKLSSLCGIDNLIKLKKIYLYGLRKLKTISEISSLTNLQELKIESCREIKKFQILEKNKEISHLEIQKLDSVEFVKKLPKLEFLKFSTCDDGDFSSLLKAKNLKQVSFRPNKKHYSHKEVELNKLLQTTL